MNNILLKFFMCIVEFICSESIENTPEKSYDSYFLYDLETFESTSLYE